MPSVYYVKPISTLDMDNEFDKPSKGPGFKMSEGDWTCDEEG